MSTHPVYTEQSNPLTESIDTLPILGMLQCLRQSDGQMWMGVGVNPSIMDEPINTSLNRLSADINTSLASGEKVLVTMAGAGTSGRISQMVARYWNQTKSDPSLVFDYIMAGTDLALMKSQEKAEDDVIQSVEDVKATIKRHSTESSPVTHFVYIGITCGMSAPCVGAQIEYLLKSSKSLRTSIVLMGFNDVSSSRNMPVEGWTRTMRQVVQDLVAQTESTTSPNAYIINPIYGGESITGSSRMKGGSTTKMLLDSLFYKIVVDPRIDFSTLFSYYLATNTTTYTYKSDIVNAISMGTEALKQGGNIFYVGSSHPALVAMMDASECPPTFGANYNDIRGFVYRGWHTVRNTEGDMAHHGKEYQIDASNLPDYQPDQTLLVILLPIKYETNDEEAYFEALLKRTASHHRLIISFQSRGDLSGSHTVYIEPKSKLLPSCQVLQDLHNDMFTKWILNALSTCSHIGKGKVYKNRMIDLKLSNNKLYFRGIQLVATLTEVTEEVARECVLMAIYKTEDIQVYLDETYPISKHIEACLPQQRIVPLAITLASMKKRGKSVNIAETTVSISETPILRNLIAKLCSEHL